MHIPLQFRTNTLFLALLSTLPALAADQVEEMRSYQMRQGNNLIRNHKPQSFFIQSTLDVPVNLDIFYRQIKDEVIDSETLLGLLPPEECFFVDTSGADADGAYTIKAKIPDDTVYLTKGRNGDRETNALILVQSINIKPGETRNIKPGETNPILPRPSITVARFKVQTPGVIPHFILSNNGVRIELSTKPNVSLPLALKPTDFTMVMSAYDKLQNPVTSVKNFREALKTQVLQGEGIEYTDFVKRLQDLHNNAVKSPFTLSDCRIPLITHTLWAEATTLTDLYNGDNGEWLQQSIQSCPQVEGWQHYVWLPLTADAEAATKTVPEQFREKVQFKALEELATFKNDYLTKGGPALASKILRFHVLNQFGGVFRGTDVEIIQSLRAFNGAYDLYCGLDSNGTAPSTSLLAAKPGHSVLQKAIALADRNLDESSKPGYLSTLSSNGTSKEATFNHMTFGFDTGLLATALFQASNIDTTVDMVLPPHIFNPKRSKAEIKHADDIRQKWHPETMAIHYLVRHWIK